MKLYVDQHFKGVTVERFAEIYHSEAFNNAVAPITGMRTRKLVEERIDDNGIRHRRVRMEPDTKLPAMIQKVADSIARGTITYDEVSTYDATTHTVHYRFDSKANDRVKVEGTIRFIPDGDGVRRVIDGVIEVKAPLGVGSVIERFIEAETVKGYGKIHAFLQRWIDEH